MHCQLFGSLRHPHLSIASATPDLAAARCCVSPMLPIAFAIAEEIEVRHVDHRWVRSVRPPSSALLPFE